MGAVHQEAEAAGLEPGNGFDSRNCRVEGNRAREGSLVMGHWKPSAFVGSSHAFARPSGSVGCLLLKPASGMPGSLTHYPHSRQLLSGLS
jgi:hypothetical protein